MRRIIVLLTVLIPAVLTGEAVARYGLGLGTPPLSIEDPSIEYMFKPSQDLYRFGNRILINEYGMRSPDFPPERFDAQELRIMVFGDSVVNGGSLIDHDYLATTLAAQALTAQINRKTIVGNISAGSWGPGNWLAYAKKYGFFDADVVLLVISSHDYADNPTFRPLNPNTHPTRRPMSAISEALTRYLPRYLNGQALRTSDQNRQNSQRNLSSQAPQEQNIRQGMQDLRQFLELAEQSAEVAVLLHPTQAELATGRHQEGRRYIEDLCNTLGIAMISLSEYYGGLGSTEDIYLDQIHINQNGQRKLADAIVERVKYQLE